MNVQNACKREFDFALVLSGVNELNEDIENALFEAGCDDATVSLQCGCLYLEFTREATSIQEAISSAIQNVYCAGIGAEVQRVDECDLVTPTEIAHRVGTSRQMIHQYMNGIRGPGDFPPPECYLTDKRPLWSWCPVSFWFYENGLISPEAVEKAEVISAVNTALQRNQQSKRNPKLVKEVEKVIFLRESACV